MYWLSSRGRPTTPRRKTLTNLSSSLTFRGERRLRRFDDEVQRRIFLPFRVVVTRDCRMLHTEELHDL
jgi:hypothetical protein